MHFRWMRSLHIRKFLRRLNLLIISIFISSFWDKKKFLDLNRNASSRPHNDYFCFPHITTIECGFVIVMNKLTLHFNFKSILWYLCTAKYLEYEYICLVSQPRTDLSINFLSVNNTYYSRASISLKISQDAVFSWLPAADFILCKWPWIF